jgi:MFS family permease
MFALLRRRNVALFWFGETVSLMGDYTLAVALPFYVLQLTGSILQTGLMFLVETLPSIVFGALAGVFVDRWNRRITMIICNLLQAGTLLLLLTVRSPHLIWVVYLVAILQALFSVFFNPAASAFVPALVDKKHLAQANALTSFGDSITRLTGLPLGGALLVSSGMSTIVLIDATSFLFSALMLFLVSLPKRQEREKQEGARSLLAQVKKVGNDSLDGLRKVRTNKVLTGLFFVAGVTFLGQGFISVMFVVYVKTILHGNGFVFSLTAMSQGAGALLGSVLIAPAQKVLRPASLLALCQGVIGVATIVFLSLPGLVSVLLMLTIIGVCVVGGVVTKQTLVQLHTLDSYRGRVFAASGMISSLALLVGMGIATLFGDRIGPVIFLDGAAFFYVLSGVVAFLMLSQARNLVEPLSAEETGSSDCKPAQR